MAVGDKDLDRDGDGDASVNEDITTRQRNKEEGKRRALEISIAKRQQQSNVEGGCNGKNTLDAKNNITGGKRATRSSARHGARNQHRHKHFSKWILENFSHIINDCGDGNDDISNQNDPEKTNETMPMHILDVAGGKGELSARLCLCHSLRVVMVDPRPADVSSVYTNSVVPKLPKKWRASLKTRLDECPKFVDDELEKRFSQLVMPFSAPSNADDENKKSFGCASLHEAVQNASLIIGLHADGATEAIVDAAILFNKPFVVVPCCVFPNLFRQRFLVVKTPSTDNTSESHSVPNDDHVDSTGYNACTERRIPVRTHEQFCQYLQAKDPRFRREILPFEGRNVAIWWDAK